MAQKIIQMQMRHLYFNLKDLFSNRKGFVILTSLLRFKNKSREFREYGLKASSCDPLILLLNTSHSHSKNVYYLNMLQSGGINVFRKMVNP